MDHFKNVPGAISFTEAIAAMLVIDKYLPEVTAKGIAVDLGTHIQYYNFMGCCRKKEV